MLAFPSSLCPPIGCLSTKLGRYRPALSRLFSSPVGRSGEVPGICPRPLLPPSSHRRSIDQAWAIPPPSPPAIILNLISGQWAFHLTKNFTLYLLFLHFLLKKFAHIKKKLYLCSDFDLLGGSRCGRVPVFEHLIHHYHTYERRTRRFVFGYLKLAISSISSRHNSCPTTSVTENLRL